MRGESFCILGTSSPRRILHCTSHDWIHFCPKHQCKPWGAAECQFYCRPELVCKCSYPLAHGEVSQPNTAAATLRPLTITINHNNNDNHNSDFVCPMARCLVWIRRWDEFHDELAFNRSLVETQLFVRLLGQIILPTLCMLLLDGPHAPSLSPSILSRFLCTENCLRGYHWLYCLLYVPDVCGCSYLLFSDDLNTIMSFWNMDDYGFKGYRCAICPE